MHTYFVHYLYTHPGSRKYGFGNQELTAIGPITTIEDVRDFEAQIALDHPAGTHVAVVNYIHLRED